MTVAYVNYAKLIYKLAKVKVRLSKVFSICLLNLYLYKCFPLNLCVVLERLFYSPIFISGGEHFGSNIVLKCLHTAPAYSKLQMLVVVKQCCRTRCVLRHILTQHRCISVPQFNILLNINPPVVSWSNVSHIKVKNISEILPFFLIVTKLQNN